MEKIKILTVPGYGGSDKEHWQTYWESEFENIARVEQSDWDNPQLDLWVKTLGSYIQPDHKYILVAHSLACSLVCHWALNNDASPILGALFVSTSDVDSSEYTPDEVRNFSPMPINTLPFKSIVIASDDDPYVALDRAQYFASQWGSEFVNVGACGHINAASNLKSWPQGQEILKRLLNSSVLSE